MRGRTPQYLRGTEIVSERLTLKAFQAADAAAVFSAIDPTLARFMVWDPPSSKEAFSTTTQDWEARIAAGTDLPLTIRGVDPKVLRSVRIFLLVWLVMSGIVVYEIADGIVEWQETVVGVLAGIGVGIVPARMTKLEWDTGAPASPAAGTGSALSSWPSMSA